MTGKKLIAVSILLAATLISPILHQPVSGRQSVCDGCPTPTGVASSGASVNPAGLRVGRTVLIKTTLTNLEDVDHEFALIVQVKDAQGIMIQCSWLLGVIEAGQSLDAGVSWTPMAPGDYAIEIFVWSWLVMGIPLSPMRSINVTVSE